MKKLLLTLFLTFGLIGTSHSNILDNLLGKMSTKDVKLYDKSYSGGVTDIFSEAKPNSIRFKAKAKNLNQEKSIKEMYIRIKTLDCKKGCKDCITADIGVYEVLKGWEFTFIEDDDTILRPNTIFQINFIFTDETKKSSYVQPSGNETCFSSRVDEVKGFHIFE
jgi:hypothetical protein